VNGGTLVYYKDDPEVSDVALKTKETIKKVAYRIHCHTIRNGITYLVHNGQETPLLIFGRHNLANIEGARNICNAMGISSSMFYQAITSFKGAAKRLEKLADNGKTRIFKDFAHAPDKLKASVNAVKEQYPHSKLAAFFELYTWSSFDKEFLKNYKDTLKDVDVQIIFCDPETAKKKGAIMPLSQEIKDAFNAPNALIFQNSTEVVNFLKNMDWNNTNLIMMSPGNYGGIDVEKLAAELAKK
jgi:UDP-N-acetylmuramate: L-alanyl-gamma-D-glutamyl-meso-diaminopimelate ligase